MIAHNRPLLGALEADAARRVLESGWVARGPETDAFERELAAFLGLPAENVVVTGSGTSALFLALWSLGARGKTVAIPGYVCAAVRNAVLMAGGVTRIIDNAPGSPNADLKTVQESGCDLAIVPHMYGIPQDVSRLAQALPVIEDCAQAFGGRVGSDWAGLTGRIGITSFYATKLLTSGGQGGALFSKDRALIDAVRDYLDFDCRRDERPRFNFQITDMQSAVGRAQLQRYSAFLDRRERVYQRYRACGADLLDAPHSVTPVRYRAVLRTAQPGALIERLKQRGIAAIVPTADWELPSGADLPHARELAHTTVSLPIYPALTDAEVDIVAEGLQAAFP